MQLTDGEMVYNHYYCVMTDVHKENIPCLCALCITFQTSGDWFANVFKY